MLQNFKEIMIHPTFSFNCSVLILETFSGEHIIAIKMSKHVHGAK